VFVQQDYFSCWSQNNMLRKLVPALCIVLVCEMVAQAAIIAVLEKQVNPGAQVAPYDGFTRNDGNQATPFTTDTQLNAGALQDLWVSYSLGVQATAGETISALDVLITTPLTATSGFHQRWTLDPDTELFTPTPSSANVTNGDSHLIVGGSVSVVAPTEDRNTVGGPPRAVGDQYGIGTTMSGLWGFSGAEQAAQLGNIVRFGYIVIPRGSEPNIQVSVGAGVNDAQGMPIVPGPVLTTQDFFGGGPPPNTAPDVIDAIVGPPYNNNEPGEPQTLIHQFVATDVETPAGPFTWDMLSLVSYTPNYGGAGPGPHLAATLSATGEFSWVSEGSPRGDYVWSVRATDPGGLSAEGTITVHANLVPEPTTLTLFGLAMVGAMGFVRRRNG
jgi:hypothetical protein